MLFRVHVDLGEFMILGRIQHRRHQSKILRVLVLTIHTSMSTYRMLLFAAPPMAVSLGAWCRRPRFAFLLIMAGATTSAFMPSDRPRMAIPFLCRRHPGTAHRFSDVLVDASNDATNDIELLETVSREQLVRLCEQCRVSDHGTKDDMLQRLRNHAAAEAEASRQRNLARRQKVEESSEDSKERYEIVSGEPDGDADDAEGFFYFELPTIEGDIPHVAETSQGREAPRAVLSSDAVTAPPPPVEANADGERVVTVYSTADQNDMTGIAAAQPGRGSSMDALSAAASSSSTPQPWDMQRTSETSTRQLENAKDKVIELVSTLLELTGAPGFASVDGDLDCDDVSYAMQRNIKQNGLKFMGFNPANVPTTLLSDSSRALRSGRGQVLQDVLRQFELQAVGQDGMNGDNIERGGGHYREVTKVRAFLEGFRRAEVRRLARETTALLLDKIVLEGVDGLDMALNTMVRSSDDTGDNAGELNDSLLDFLNDAIREQQKKVDAHVGPHRVAGNVVPSATLPKKEDNTVERLWDVSEKDGQRIESLDLSNPEVKRILEAEVAKASEAMQPNASVVPGSAPEVLLLLLTLLRERVKTEAAFAPDEKGRNLRLLAYCLRVSSEEEREQLILKDIGISLDVSSLECLPPWQLMFTQIAF